MNRLVFIPILLLIVLLPACVKPVILTPTVNEQTFSSVKPEEVTFSTTAIAEKPYKEIGYIFAQGESWKNALKLAKEKAAKQGGNAIINGRGSSSVQITGIILFFPIYTTFYFTEGTVVRYE